MQWQSAQTSFFKMLICNLKPSTLKFSKKNGSSTAHVTPPHWLELYPSCPSPHPQHPTSGGKIFVNGSLEASYQNDSMYQLWTPSRKAEGYMLNKQSKRGILFLSCETLKKEGKKRIPVSRSSNWPSSLRKHHRITEAPHQKTGHYLLTDLSIGCGTKSSPRRCYR